MEAEAMGWRTFSAGNPLPGHMVCPASKERGHVTDCSHCTACGGTMRRGRSITIQIHGYRASTNKCYVNVPRAPLSIWKCYSRGRYARLENYEVFRDRVVRFGAYGEPVTIPLDIVRNIVAVAAHHTGYTHQWRKAWAQGYREYFMASTVS
jgi:hypothetical protein